MMRGEQVEHVGDGHGAVADRAAHEPVALVGELDAIVLEVQVAHVRGDDAREVERRLGRR